MKDVTNQSNQGTKLLLQKCWMDIVQFSVQLIASQISYSSESDLDAYILLAYIV